MSRKSDTADGGRSVSYRPGGQAHPAAAPAEPGGGVRGERDDVDVGEVAVERPVHAEPSRSGVLTLSSIEPVGCTHRRRTPVDVPSQTRADVVGGEAVVALRAVEDLGQALDQPAEHPDRRLDGPSATPGRRRRGSGSGATSARRTGLPGGPASGATRASTAAAVTQRRTGADDADGRTALDGLQRDHRHVLRRGVAVRRHRGVGPPQHGLDSSA